MSEITCAPHGVGLSVRQESRRSRRWSGRNTLLFILSAGLVSWGLLIGKAIWIL